MDEKLKRYLEGVFAPYEDMKAIKELKEELFYDLKEKLNDLKNEGYDEEMAYHKTIDSLGDISEIVESINAKTRELQQMVGMDFTKSNLENSDFKSVKLLEGKFNYSNLQGSDFRDSDLSHASFKCSNLDKAKFDGANLTGTKITKSNLKGASFIGCIFDQTDFTCSELGGINFEGQTFKGTCFNYTGLKGTSFKNALFQNVSFKTDAKKAIFEGATMDKATYAILKGYKANLTNVTVI